jgi:hypothetical protein
MQDNFNLKGFLRNNKLLNEGIGGYFDLKPLKEDFQDFIERVHQELTPEESDWLVDNVDDLKAKFPKQFAELDGDVDGMTALVKQLYFEKDADSEMNELNDLGNMEEADDSFIQAQRDAASKKSSMTSDKGWEYDDDYTSSSNEFDFEDFDNSDLNGPSTEMVIDDLIGEFEQLIKSQVPEELHDSARTAVKELWKDKLASWGI